MQITQTAANINVWKKYEDSDWILYDIVRERERQRGSEIERDSHILTYTEKNMIKALDVYWCCQYNSVSLSCFPSGSECERWIFLGD